MTWREVWDANLDYDVESNNVTAETRTQFLEELGSQFPPPSTDDDYLATCDKVVRSNPDRFLRQGRRTQLDDTVVVCVRTVRDLCLYNSQEEAIHREGDTGEALVAWFQENYRPEFLRKSLGGRKPLVWITRSVVLDQLEQVTEEQRGDAAQKQLALANPADEYYVRIDIPSKQVDLRAPTTFDGGPGTLFVADVDDNGWGRTCDSSNCFHAPEAVSPPVRAESLNVRLLGKIRTPGTSCEPGQRAQFIRQRPRPRP